MKKLWYKLMELWKGNDNEWIVNNCDMVIAYINQTHGGAYTAYKTAKRRNKMIVNLGLLAC